MPLAKASRSFSSAIARVDGMFNALACFAVFFMCVPTVVDILCRLLISSSVPGAAELVEFSMLVLVFGSMAFIQDEESHITVTLLTEKMPERLRGIFDVFNASAPAILFSIMAYAAWQLGMAKIESGEVSPMLYIPQWPFVFFLTAGAALMVLALAATTLRKVSELAAKGRLADVLAVLLMLAGIIWMMACLRDTPLAEDYVVLGFSGMAFLMLLILFGMPIGQAMCLVGYIGMLSVYPDIEASYGMLSRGPYNQAASYTFSVVPMFILMGEFALHSGISKDLFRAASVWLGRMPGGLFIATITGCAGFAAVAGDSMATAVTMGTVALPEMKNKGYDPGLSCATLAAGGTLGILIPPSTGFIFYALVTDVSIGKLFVAGIIPGIVLALLFIGYALFFAYRNPQLAPRGEASTVSEKFSAIFSIIPMLVLIAFVLGGILFGIFTPNEGAGAGAFGTMLYAMARRRLSWKLFIETLKGTCRITGAIMMIIVGVNLLGYFFAATSLPSELADIVMGMNANKYVLFAGVVVLYIVLGCLLNVIPMILLTLPTLFPTIEAVGFDPVWFGVAVVILMEMGQITPPVGVNVFAMSTMANDVPMSRIFQRIVPYFVCMLLLEVLLCFFPELATGLVDVLFK